MWEQFKSYALPIGGLFAVIGALGGGAFFGGSTLAGLLGGMATGAAIVGSIGLLAAGVFSGAFTDIITGATGLNSPTSSDSPGDDSPALTQKIADSVGENYSKDPTGTIVAGALVGGVVDQVTTGGKVRRTLLKGTGHGLKAGTQFVGGGALNNTKDMATGASRMATARFFDATSEARALYKESSKILRNLGDDVAHLTLDQYRTLHAFQNNELAKQMMQHDISKATTSKLNPRNMWAGMKHFDKLDEALEAGRQLPGSAAVQTVQNVTANGSTYNVSQYTKQANSAIQSSASQTSTAANTVNQGAHHIVNTSQTTASKVTGEAAKYAKQTNNALNNTANLTKGTHTISANQVQSNLAQYMEKQSALQNTTAALQQGSSQAGTATNTVKQGAHHIVNAGQTTEQVVSNTTTAAVQQGSSQSSTVSKVTSKAAQYADEAAAAIQQTSSAASSASSAAANSTAQTASSVSQSSSIKARAAGYGLAAGMATTDFLYDQAGYMTGDLEKNANNRTNTAIKMLSNFDFGVTSLIQGTRYLAGNKNAETVGYAIASTREAEQRVFQPQKPVLMREELAPRRLDGAPGLSEYSKMDSIRRRMTSYFPGGKIDGVRIDTAKLDSQVDMYKESNRSKFRDALEKMYEDAQAREEKNDSKIFGRVFLSAERNAAYFQARSDIEHIKAAFKELDNFDQRSTAYIEGRYHPANKATGATSLAWQNANEGEFIAPASTPTTPQHNSDIQKS